MGADSFAGRTLGHYRIDRELGRGGMGVVYRGEDTRLQRSVAIKVLPPDLARHPDLSARFLREARAASALSHPNIVTVHAVESIEGHDFIVMELVTGDPLDQVIAAGPLPMARVAELGAEIAGALAAAHAVHIVHRDIKPSNVLVSASGAAKVADFGLARQARPVDPEEVTAAGVEALRTRAGVVMGTVGYMAPEQARGDVAGPAADVFALGVTLYEMACGRRPFDGPAGAAVASGHRPRLLSAQRPDVPPAFAALVDRCLAAAAADRPPAADLASALKRLAAPEPAAASVRTSRRVVTALAVVLVAVVAAGAWWWRESRRRAWARDVAAPEVRRLVGEGAYVDAFQLATRAAAAAPGDKTVLQQLFDASFVASIESQPAGADVAFSPYATEGAWTPLGKTPLSHVRIPVGVLRWRATLAGHEPVESTGDEELDENNETVLRFTLVPTGTSRAGMVPVSAGPARVGRTRTVVPAFWIDRTEVRNRDYQVFVDQGGYGRPEFWTDPELTAPRNGRAVTFEMAVSAFRDTTGRQGPAGWSLGAFPDGQGDHPVQGVSWFEATAYARFRQRMLPTAFHWVRASGMFNIFSDILWASNFNQARPVPVGTMRGLGPFGTADMAGNVREWTSTSIGARRLILGGAWNQPVYVFSDPDAAFPFDRDLRNGFRLVDAIDEAPSPLPAVVDRLARDYGAARRVSPEVFDAYERLYAYDPLPLDLRQVAQDDSSPHWRREQVTVAAAYGGERLPIVVFVPKAARPPYQAVVYSPASDAVVIRSSARMSLVLVDFVVRSGRLLVYPIIKGTFERGATAGGRLAHRDLTVQRAKDIRRAVDYVLSRPDVDAGRLAFYGASLGAQDGLVAPALEPRFKAIVLFAGGLTRGEEPPEIDTFQFVPRITAPTLMVNGREDFDAPLETAQKPLFEALGARAADKKHVIVDGGHIPTRFADVIRAILDWLDERFGPVAR